MHACIGHDAALRPALREPRVHVVLSVLLQAWSCIAWKLPQHEARHSRRGHHHAATAAIPPMKPQRIHAQHVSASASQICEQAMR